MKTGTKGTGRRNSGRMTMKMTKWRAGKVLRKEKEDQGKTGTKGRGRRRNSGRI